MPDHLSARALAIIPARGGSKGIPRKNVRPIAGKPMIAWTIEAARAARHVARVIVSTDDPEIADVARRHGADVVARPAEISGDVASSESALLHVVDHLKQTGQPVSDVLVFLQCTSPLTTSADIDATVERMLADNADTALAVTSFHYFLWKPDASGNAVGINHDKRVRPMRQQREPQWLETGAVYAMRTAGFVQAKHRFFGRTAMHEMPPQRVLEIDEETDLELAEQRLRLRVAADRLGALPERVRAVVFDFDGVFTDNRVTLSETGVEHVACDRSDGLGLETLRRSGVHVLVLSGEANPVVAARCAKLKLECLHGIKDKAPTLRKWLAAHGIDGGEVVYVGNDVNDLQCLQLVGCGAVVADAHPDVLPAAALVLERTGGRGAVRELCDLVLRRNADVERHPAAA